jgi:exodeoxyribonuclease-3
VKIATFNANSLRSRIPIVIRWLSENRPDVLCVQETKVQDVDFPHEAFEKTGYEYAFKGQKSYNGVAIFSKSKISKVEFGFRDEPRDEARILKVVVRGMTIVNTYVPQGYEPDSEKFQYKLQWFKRLRKYFTTNFKPSGKVLWLGDLNIAPLSIDVYDPKGLLGHVCYHPEVHKVLKKVMEWGFTDVFRMHCKEAGQYTFWDYRMNAFRRNAGWRLDHIMATQSMAKKSTACYIDLKPRLAEKPSDHTFLVAEFNL